jgi:hypothetical protein
MFDIFFLSKASAQKSIGEPKHRKLQNVFFFWPLRTLADIKHLKVNYQNIFYNYNLPLHRPQVAPATKTTGWYTKPSLAFKLWHWLLPGKLSIFYSMPCINFFYFSTTFQFELSGTSGPKESASKKFGLEQTYTSNVGIRTNKCQSKPCRSIVKPRTYAVLPHPRWEDIYPCWYGT